jgi:glyoxylate reductase
MTKRILITCEIPTVGLDMLKEKGFEVDVCPGETGDASLSQDELISYLTKNQYDGIISLLTDKIDVRLMEAAPSVKIVANYAAGFNNIDVAEAKKRGIVATNTPGVSSLAVAEHAMALMLALTTRIVEADLFTKKGKYKGWSPMAFIGTDLSGKTLGLVGVGSIGIEVARIAAQGFTMKIVYYDVVPNEKIEKEYGAQRVATVEELLPRVDVVSLHVPLLDSTHHLINAARLKMMKKSAFLINTSRGPVVDENALVTALKERLIAGAALDVFEFEPELAPGLATLDNVILTPHIASARDHARNEMARMAAQNIIDFFDGKTPHNQVNL